MKFETIAGKIEGEINDKNVKVKMIDPHSYNETILDLPDLGEKQIFSINTGVPHAVIFVDDMDLDVYSVGKFVRYNEKFAPNGTNVNFVKIKNENEIIVRAYERGVENETLSCGSGSTASAIISGKKYDLNSPIFVNTKSSEVLKIYFDLEDGIKNVYLEGLVDVVFEGKRR